MPKFDEFQNAYNKQHNTKNLFSAKMDNQIQYKLNSEVEINGKNGYYELEIEAQSDTVLLGISKYFRNEWIAKSNQENLTIFPLFNTFLGLLIPPNTSKISISYYPKTKIILNNISNMIIFVCIGFLLVNRKRLRSNHNDN